MKTSVTSLSVHVRCRASSLALSGLRSCRCGGMSQMLHQMGLTGKAKGRVPWPIPCRSMPWCIRCSQMKANGGFYPPSSVRPRGGAVVEHNGQDKVVVSVQDKASRWATRTYEAPTLPRLLFTLGLPEVVFRTVDRGKPQYPGSHGTQQALRAVGRYDT
ncbi:hypothetical protein BD413DRAFT_214444 [Trametes elegans]|nr:hypothetical protein BD413DRAFT_214444 [Trametes elegans]